MEEENSKTNELGFKEMATNLSPLGLYVGNRKMKLPLRPNTRIHVLEGHFGNRRRRTIGQMPDDRTLSSLDGSHAFPTRVHYVKTSNRSHNICNGPLTLVTCTHTCNGCYLAPVIDKRGRLTLGLASATPVTNVYFW
jgi:hypothetical protein